MSSQVPRKSFSDTELWRSLCKKSSDNKGSVSNSKQIIIKLSNPVSDTVCPSCSNKVSVEFPLLPGLIASTSENRSESVGRDRIGDVLGQETLKMGSGHVKSSRSSLRPCPPSSTVNFKTGEEMTLQTQVPDSSSVDKIEVIAVNSLEASSFESFSSDEIIHLLPMAFSSSKKVANKSKKDKHLSMRIKDEMKIDLKRENEGSLTSLLNFKWNSRNKIYPIEEVSESSCSSSRSKRARRTAKEQEEQDRIEQISRIIAHAITKAKDRPKTRRGWMGECSR